MSQQEAKDHWQRKIYYCPRLGRFGRVWRKPTVIHKHLLSKIWSSLRKKSQQSVSLWRLRKLKWIVTRKVRENVIWEMTYIKKTKENISLFEMCNLLQQRKKLLEAFDPKTSKSQDDVQSEEEISEASIGGKSKSQTLPFLLSFEIFNHNVHNSLVDSGASSNVMPLSICRKINGQPTPSLCKII